MIQQHSTVQLYSWKNSIKNIFGVMLPLVHLSAVCIVSYSIMSQLVIATVHFTDSLDRTLYAIILSQLKYVSIL